jgi:serine acetyltransferase
VFCNFTVVTSNTKIGRFFQCNMGSTIGHDCVIGDYVTLAPGARVNGRVTIEDHAFIGSGAIIVDGTKKPIVIGKGAVIGMGSVILDSVPAGATVFGNPSRVYARAS